MLSRLTIRNYALIHHLEMSPDAGLNVITGETGAGKSIMLGAIGLLLGNRADSKALWDTNEKCVIEGTFDLGAYQLEPLFTSLDLDYAISSIFRREITPAGKSRAFINDTPVTLDILGRIGEKLMHIHSQHAILQLSDKNHQLYFIDTLAGNTAAREAYTQAWTHYAACKNQVTKLREEADTFREQTDYVRFQLNELTEATILAGEEEQLEQDIKRLDNAETIKGHIHQITAILGDGEYAAGNSLLSAKSILATLSGYGKPYTNLLERLENLRAELDDLVGELANSSHMVDFDPEQAEIRRGRLSILNQLMQKHKVQDTAALLQKQGELEKWSAKGSDIESLLAQAEQDFSAAEKVLEKTGNHLSEARQQYFTSFADTLVSRLADLGIPNASLQIAHAQVDPGPTGIDQVEMLFSANKGMPVRPLAKVASGGEFSRFMFAIKYMLAEKTALPTLLLDEIDAGISGEVARMMGKMMQKIAASHQLLVITHLPQMAAIGARHYHVFKDDAEEKTKTRIRGLTENERLQEIASMIGGANPSASALKNAEELRAQ